MPGALHDPDGTALRRLGLDPAGHHAAHHLIRPDGHIGYRTRGSNLTGLHAYRTRWLPGIPTRHSRTRPTPLIKRAEQLACQGIQRVVVESGPGVIR